MFNQMNLKYIYIITAFVLLFGIIFYMEDRPENITETSYWKKNWKTILYVPPSEDWCGGEGKRFMREKVKFSSLDSLWKNQPLYTQTFSNEGKDYSYEANYNVKNSFSELSALKTKIIEKATDQIKSSYCLDESGPKFILSEDSNFDADSEDNKILIFGKKITTDEGRVAVLIGQEVIAPFNYIIEKFRTTNTAFRERTLIPSSSGYLKSIEFRGQGNLVQVQNYAEKNQYGNYLNKWSRTTQERAVISPDLGNQWDGIIKGLRTDFYFDEPGAPSSSSVNTSEPEASLLVEPSEGRKIRISFYGLVPSASEKYRLVQREISPGFLESPVLIKEESFVKLIESMERVKNASRYERPSQKIQ